MWRSIIFLCLVITVCAMPDNNNQDTSCKRCNGREHQCVNGECQCAEGYILSGNNRRCVRCPVLGEPCSNFCCNWNNTTLECWMGFCQSCRDSQNNWICRDPLDNIVLISSTQIAMATALILGIIATFVLLYKLCAVTNLRPMGQHSNSESRLSIGSLQVYVEERLRDAPPRYSRTIPAGTAAIPASVYVNAGFIHDSSIPPPPYTPEKDEGIHQNASVHI